VSASLKNPIAQNHLLIYVSFLSITLNKGKNQKA